MTKSLLLLLPLTVLLSGCIQQIAVSTVADIVHDGFGGIMEESDLEFAGLALPGNLKLLEVMLKSDPDNVRILLLLSEGYSSYSLGFVEDQDHSRARAFYLRASEYGLRAVRQNDALAIAMAGPADSLRNVLRESGEDHIAALFWTAFGLGSYMNLSLSDPDALAELPRVEAIMEYVAKEDSAFYHGGADIFLGTLYGSRPRMLGGNTDRARAHFERAMRINRGTFLLTYVYYARSVALQTLNEALFDELLLKVENTSVDIRPEIRLPNAIAKEKAQRLRTLKADYF